MMQEWILVLSVNKIKKNLLMIKLMITIMVIMIKVMIIVFSGPESIHLKVTLPYNQNAST